LALLNIEVLIAQSLVLLLYALSKGTK